MQFTKKLKKCIHAVYNEKKKKTRKKRHMYHGKIKHQCISGRGIKKLGTPYEKTRILRCPLEESLFPFLIGKSCYQLVLIDQ